MDIKIETVEVKAHGRTLKDRWTIEPQQSMIYNSENATRKQKFLVWLSMLFRRPHPYCRVMHGLNVEEELTRILQDEIIKEIAENGSYTWKELTEMNSES